MLRTWIVVVQAAIWGGIAAAARHAGVDQRALVPVGLLAVWQLILLYPYLLPERETTPEDTAADVAAATDLDEELAMLTPEKNGRAVR